LKDDIQAYPMCCIRIDHQYIFSGNIPEDYDQYLGSFFFEPYAIDLCSRIEDTGKMSSVLELACGTGRVTRHLAKSFPGSTKITATDINPDMLAKGKSLVPDSSISWMVADAQDLPLKDNEFDCAVCQFGVMFIPDKPKAFKEVHRVVRKGGQFLYNTWDRLEYHPSMQIAHDVVTRFFQDNPPAFYGIPFSMYDKDTLRSLMEDAGFTDVTVTRVSKTGHSPSAMHLAKGLVIGNPIRMEIAAKDPNSLDEIIKEIADKIDQEIGSPVNTELHAWVVKGVK